MYVCLCVCNSNRHRLCEVILDGNEQSGQFDAAVKQARADRSDLCFSKPSDLLSPSSANAAMGLGIMGISSSTKNIFGSPKQGSNTSSGHLYNDSEEEWVYRSNLNSPKESSPMRSFGEMRDNTGGDGDTDVDKCENLDFNQMMFDDTQNENDDEDDENDPTLQWMYSSDHGNLNADTSFNAEFLEHVEAMFDVISCRDIFAVQSDEDWTGQDEEGLDDRGDIDQLICPTVIAGQIETVTDIISETVTTYGMDKVGREGETGPDNGDGTGNIRAASDMMRKGKCVLTAAERKAAPPALQCIAREIPTLVNLLDETPKLSIRPLHDRGCIKSAASLGKLTLHRVCHCITHIELLCSSSCKYSHPTCLHNHFLQDQPPIWSQENGWARFG